jgi:hypothetical protein
MLNVNNGSVNTVKGQSWHEELGARKTDEKSKEIYEYIQ